MDALAEQLDAKLRQWKPDTTEQVRQHVAEIIEMADLDAWACYGRVSWSKRS